MRTDEPILTISVAASLLGLHPRTLMLYEKWNFIKPFRTGTNRRMYTINNLDEFQFLKYLTQVEGINLQGVRVVFKALEEGQKLNIDLRSLVFPNFKAQQLI